MSTRARGGPQHIPRPDGAVAGEPAPWADLSPAERDVDLGVLAGRLAARTPRILDTGRVAERESAVLVPLYERSGHTQVILTRRSRHLRSHRFEVSFPGGGRDAGESLWQTAVREAHEEITLDPTVVRPIGRLDAFVTVGSRSLVHPWVAVLDELPAGLSPNPREVETIIHAPVSELLSDEVYREERWPIDGELRPITFFELVGDTVWGATAAMLRQLLAIATGTEDRLAR